MLSVPISLQFYSTCLKYNSIHKIFVCLKYNTTEVAYSWWQTPYVKMVIRSLTLKHITLPSGVTLKFQTELKTQWFIIFGCFYMRSKGISYQLWYDKVISRKYGVVVLSCLLASSQILIDEFLLKKNKCATNRKNVICNGQQVQWMRNSICIFSPFIWLLDA